MLFSLIRQFFEFVNCKNIPVTFYFIRTAQMCWLYIYACLGKVNMYQQPPWLQN